MVSAWGVLCSANGKYFEILQDYNISYRLVYCKLKVIVIVFRYCIEGNKKFIQF